MKALLERIGGRALALLVVAALVVGVLVATMGGSDTRTVTAYFSQAVSVYKGSDVDIMGVRVGRVTAVVPEGDKVRVEMQYDAQYKLPADVKAAIVTPTLVADRFVQLAPAYTGGPSLGDGGDIPLDHTAVPVELDRIYASIGQLTHALGPNGANRKGALSALLHASAKALKGNGSLGNEMLANLSKAAQTFGDNSGQLFSTVDNLAQVTRTLQTNDKVVGGFLDHLSTVSTQLAGERGDLRKALVAIARAVGIVRSFVHDNRTTLVSDVKRLGNTLDALSSQKDVLAKVLQLAPLGLGNLVEAFDVHSGTVGIRLQLPPEVSSIGNVLCQTLKINHASSANPACALLEALLPGVLSSSPESTGLGSGTGSGTAGGGTSRLGSSAPQGGLVGLLGGGR